MMPPALAKIAYQMACRGASHAEIAAALAAATGLLRSYVVDLMRRNQSLWLAP